MVLAAYPAGVARANGEITKGGGVPNNPFVLRDCAQAGGPCAYYQYIQGTSMAAPHTTGVIALIVSEFGAIGNDGDVILSPTKVESYMQNTAIDIGKQGYDECFGNGRTDALRAVQHDTSSAYDATAPACPEYEE